MARLPLHGSVGGMVACRGRGSASTGRPVGGVGYAPANETELGGARGTARQGVGPRLRSTGGAAWPVSDPRPRAGNHTADLCVRDQASADGAGSPSVWRWCGSATFGRTPAPRSGACPSTSAGGSSERRACPARSLAVSRMLTPWAIHSAASARRKTGSGVPRGPGCTRLTHGSGSIMVPSDTTEGVTSAGRHWPKQRFRVPDNSPHWPKQRFRVPDNSPHWPKQRFRARK